MVDIVVPKWGLTMDEATIASWLVQIGDSVGEGDPIVEIETDKTTGDLESPASGVLVEILVTDGTDVVPGDVIGRIEPA